MQKQTIIFILLVSILCSWVLGRVFGSDAIQDTDSQKQPLLSVKTKISKASPKVLYINATGFSEADRKVDLKAEVQGRITEILVKEGSAVKAGAIIAKIDPRDKVAKKMEAEANLSQKRLEYEAAKKLHAKDFKSDTGLALAKAEFNQAEAQLASVEREIDHTIIKAPFDGVLELSQVEVGSFVDIGDVVGTVMDLDPLVAVINIPESEISLVKVGQKAKIKLLGDQEIAGDVHYISQIADDKTRSFRVEIDIPNKDRSVPEGISLEVGIPIGDRMAHNISPAILSLDDNGVIGVKLVKEGLVKFMPVKIIDSNNENLWVTGLPDQAEIITVGQEFTVDNQKVNPVREGV